MGEKTSKPLTISKTVAPPPGLRKAGFEATERPAARRHWGREEGPGQGRGSRRYPRAGDIRQDHSPREYRLKDLASEWMLDLQVLDRSQRTLDWYRQKIDAYFARGGAESLEDFTAYEVKRYVVELQDRGLAPNTVHGCFQVLRGFANWANGQDYPIDPALLRLRAPKLPQVEMESYSPAERDAIVDAASPAWARLAVAILLGTGVRISELCAIRLDDFEDDGQQSFLKIRRGKGAKFRRVPVSHKLRREIVRYLNRSRPEAEDDHLLLLSDGRPLQGDSCARMLHRLGRRVGLRVHAHKFRHTFATTYLRNGGDIERLRKILGHSTYAMVMRYVHLDAGDLHVDFDERTPF
jgi:site-specific recombinase XerD